ncbi:MAG: 23S rRNA (pseudouridine(1915)-N(3))-methyltransferase RlmH [Rhodospirillaceae bacterium]|nr:23S rRNA (pseudouridine(1915)-N(3))-methyltransferase RlmH [Rhodospirillaceae bacterium]
MRVTIVAIGRYRSGLLHDLYDHYASRLRWRVDLKEIEVKSVGDQATNVRKEGARLLAAIPHGARVVVLDESGKTLTSRALARWIGRAQNDSVDDLALMIGGADGLDGTVLDRADLILSLGRVTWPHFLVRSLVAEQLYRAQQILQGHPYHRD